ncbi:MAG: hypothetical protein NVSMB25_21260 [Thermoleophilaceae bacterium]
MRFFFQQAASSVRGDTVAQMREAAARRLGAPARRARREVLIVAPLVVAVLLLYRYRISLLGVDLPARVGCAAALVGLGWWLARDVGRAASPALLRRLEPSTAGTIGFLIRLFLLLVALVVALRIAGLQPGDLAVGGAFTAVVFGLAAQSTLGNVFAGLLLLGVRPFKVGDRVRLQAGALAGHLEGVVSSLGLLYVTFVQGEDTTMVPNSVVLNAAVVPLREPAAVDLRARLKPDVKPSELQAYLERSVETQTRSNPHISLEEIDDEEVVMRIRATPELARDGSKLADEILEAVSRVTRAGDEPHARAETGPL